MLQESFEKLCTKLRPYIQKNKGFQDPISVEKQVAAALYYCANEGRIRKVANSVDIEKSTISKLSEGLGGKGGRKGVVQNYSLVSI